MKRLSIKAKLTLLYGSIMTIMTLVILGVLMSLSSQEILSSTKSTLEERVSKAFEEITYTHDTYTFENDLLELEDGVYLSVYDPQGELLYGRIPYGFLYDLPFEDGSTREVKSEDTEYYVMDMSYSIQQGEPLIVRGIISITKAEASIRYAMKLIIILLPILLIISILIGYFLAKRALSPVQTITERVLSIVQENDLKKRVELGSGKDEIYQMAATFDALLEQMQNNLLREQQFTSDVSHEIRTPLSVILMQCETMLQDMQPTDPRYGELELIQKKAQSLRDITSQLLMLSRADRGTSQITKEPLNFSELSAGCIEEIKEATNQKQIQVEMNIQKDLWMLGDQTLLIRFWMNVLNNAITYGKEHGHLRIMVSEISQQICIQVQDDGIGIREDELPHIWERFYRADHSRTSNENAGLGLSMVKWIMEVHEGSYEVSSSFGQGTQFTFLLPLSVKK